jgi:ATP-binding cassette subfamily F protein uup
MQSAPIPPAPELARKVVKLSYKIQRELDELPQLIEKLEQRVAALNAEAASADFYQRKPADVTAHLQKIADAQLELDQAYERWVELSG